MRRPRSLPLPRPRLGRTRRAFRFEWSWLRWFDGRRPRGANEPPLTGPNGTPDRIWPMYKEDGTRDTDISRYTGYGHHMIALNRRWWLNDVHTPWFPDDFGRRQPRPGEEYGGGSATMLLSFPQWQGEGGANAAGITRGTRCVENVVRRLLPGAQLAYVPCLPPPPAGEPAPPRPPADSPAGGIRWRDDLQEQAAAALELLDEHVPNCVLCAGGDCAVDLPIHGWLQWHHKGDVALLYIDAHADLNTAAESPSGNFHGMSLRALLGDAPEGLEPARTVEPRSVILAGVRELDPPEEAALRRMGDIKVIPAEALRGRSRGGYETVYPALLATGRRRLHVHLDLDVLDPKCFPYVSAPSPGGLNVQDLQSVLNATRQAVASGGMSLVGITVTECRPQNEKEEARCEMVLDMLLGRGGLDVIHHLGNTKQMQAGDTLPKYHGALDSRERTDPRSDYGARVAAAAQWERPAGRIEA